MGPGEPASPEFDTINFCNTTFFENTPTCSDAWKRSGNDAEKKKDLQNFQCKGKSITCSLIYPCKT
jgi:hypothetical protein